MICGEQITFLLPFSVINGHFLQCRLYLEKRGDILGKRRVEMVERIAIYMIGRMKEANLIHEDMAERYFYVLTCRLEKYITIGAVLLISIFAHSIANRDAVL